MPEQRGDQLFRWTLLFLAILAGTLQLFVVPAALTPPAVNSAQPLVGAIPERVIVVEDGRSMRSGHIIGSRDGVKVVTVDPE